VQVDWFEDQIVEMQKKLRTAETIENRKQITECVEMMRQHRYSHFFIVFFFLIFFVMPSYIAPPPPSSFVLRLPFFQCAGSGCSFILAAGSGSRSAKMTHKI
jgi:hypothetical protein